MPGFTEAEIAPHGRDDNGKPMAPYGYLTNGNPRKSNRGARPGQRGTNGSRGTTTPKMTREPKAVIGNLSDADRKMMLVDLTDIYVVAPLAAASKMSILEKRFGKNQADALAADALIINYFMPDLADGLILMSKTKPGMLSWMDKIEENAPVLVLASAGLKLVKALAENHFRPRPDLAEAGRNLAAMKMAEFANKINAEAAMYARMRAEADYSANGQPAESDDEPTLAGV